MVRMARFVVVSLVVIATGVLAASAAACSCAARPEPERFAAAEGAFIGTLLERRDATPPGQPYQSSGDPFVNVYRVDEAFKGPFKAGETVEIHTARFDASCGLSHPVGTQIALYPRRREAIWGGGSCDVGTFDGMRAAAAAAAPKPVVKRLKRKRRATRCKPRSSVRRSVRRS